MLPVLWVYPRVCGGTYSRRSGQMENDGLSPRVRGNQASVDGPGVYHGSIPACAGEPGLEVRPQGFDVVYPRVCGGTGSS